jgi:hypothetical protein
MVEHPAKWRLHRSASSSSNHLGTDEGRIVEPTPTNGTLQKMDRPEGVLGYHRTMGDVRPLPAWAKYLVALGRFSVEHTLGDRRMVIGVSLPTRAFGAALAGLGVAQAAYPDPEKRDPREHFEYLRNLAAGTPIRFRNGRYLHCASLLGVEVRGGVDYLAHQCRLNGVRRPCVCAGHTTIMPASLCAARRVITSV